MNAHFHAAMLKATALANAGRLQEAKKVIQLVLQHRRHLVPPPRDRVATGCTPPTLIPGHDTT